MGNFEFLFRIFLPTICLSLTIFYFYLSFHRHSIGDTVQKLILTGHYVLLYALFVLFFAYLVYINSRFPVANITEAVVIVVVILAFSNNVLEWILRDRSFSFLLLPMITILAILGALILDTEKTLPIEFRTYHWPIHVIFALCGYVLFFISFALAVAYELKYRIMKKKKSGLRLFEKIPPLETVDYYMGKSVVIGVALMSVGLVFGALWMVNVDVADGERMMLKGLMSFLSWVVFASYMVLRNKLKLYGRKGVPVIAAAFVLLLINFFIGNHGI